MQILAKVLDRYARLRRPSVIAALVLCMSILSSCSNNDGVAPPDRALGTARPRVMNCGASYSITIEDDDPIMHPYGEGYSSETLNVCETWVGNDYNVYAQVASSTDNEPDVTDEVQGSNYQSGSITPYGEDQAAITEPVHVANSAFDLMVADANLRQASYDDPYYGIRSGDSGGCGQFDCIQQIDPGAKNNAVVAITPITRRGVRALIGQTTELPPGPATRRFLKKNGDVETIYSVDPLTQLLVGEELISPTQHLVGQFFWRKVAKGWVRDHSEIVSTELIDGKPVTSKSTVTISNFQTNDWGN
jgi:hypothetical protein